MKSRYYVQIIPPLDIELMRECAKKIVGKHDFSSFSVKNGDSPSTTVRLISRLEIIEKGDELTFEVEGPGFLYKMVRSIVGTLIWIGRGKLSPDCIEKMFDSGDRALGGKTLAANGLVLKKVKY